MRPRTATLRSPRALVAVAVVGAILAGCSGDDARDDDPPATTVDADEPGVEPADDVSDGQVDGAPGGPVIDAVGHADTVVALTGLLPADVRGVFAADLEALRGAAPDAVRAWSNRDGGDPLVTEPLGTIGLLAADVGPAELATALLVHTTDPTDGQFLVAKLAGEPATSDVTDGGNRSAVLPGGLLVAGSEAAVQSVLAVVDGDEEGGANTIAPFLPALDATAQLSYVYALPALFDGRLAATGSLRSAEAVSAAFGVDGEQLAGTMAFHTADAEEFVDTYNSLNLPSTQGDVPLEQPLTLGDPVAAGLGQVIVTLPPAPLDPSFDELRASRNQFKKLFAGMDAWSYAAAVAERVEPAWLDFVVKSEADGDTPPSPGSVYIRWEFRDEAARLAFEENELPAGFRLAPTQFLETDDPVGEYFFALNIYNAGGGSIVTGARAEWDVFVHGPDGADPNAGERPRFQVVEVLAEEVSADSRDLLTTAQPLSHELVDGLVVSDIRRFEGDGEVEVFSSTFPVPDPATAEVARFTREMAIGNDYIYWAHGVSDRVLYNATTFNHDSYFVDTSQLTFTDNSRWAEYLKPEVKDAVYYVNSLEYVASPMANLDSEYLDITPEWLAELVAFTTNGHQSGLMRGAVEQFFRGEGDPFVGVHLPNDTPAAFVNFEITDPAALEEALDLPPGNRLAPTTLFVGGEAAHYLTLSVFEFADASEGTRAEWSVYVDDGSGRPPHLMVIDLLTEEVAFDSYGVVNPPSEVRHALADGVISTRLASPTVTFDASFGTADVSEHELSLDWIEAGDIVCSLADICDLAYYDAETLDVPVSQPADVTVNELSTPWNSFIDTESAVVFYRDNAQEQTIKRWYDLDVVVDELPFTGLDDRTHAITGSGTLVGRTDSVADSEYTYTGDLLLDGDQVTFAIDQEVVNQLGVGNIFTTGSFDLATGTGTQTVVDCQGPSLLCSDIENGSTAFYTAGDLDASDPDAITWQVDVVVDLGPFGIADSASTFTATREG